jgi:hypothetical protein
MHAKRTFCLAGAAFAAALTLSAARAATSASVNAAANATVRPAGPRSGTSGVRYFNVEGSTNGANASFGVLRFDASDLKSAFEADYGVGGYAITNVTLALTEANSAFTAPGTVGFAFSSDNTTDISSANTSLKYDAVNSPSSNQFVQQYIGDGAFTTTGNTNNGKVDEYALLTGTAGSLSLANAIQGGGTVTLIVNDLTPAVAATWAGAANTSVAPPALRVTAASAASVPEPSALALLAGAAPALLALRRRRA